MLHLTKPRIRNFMQIRTGHDNANSLFRNIGDEFIYTWLIVYKFNNTRSLYLEL